MRLTYTNYLLLLVFIHRTMLVRAMQHGCHGVGDKLNIMPATHSSPFQETTQEPAHVRH